MSYDDNKVPTFTSVTNSVTPWKSYYFRFVIVSKGWVITLVWVWSLLLSEAHDDVDKPSVVQQSLVSAPLWHLLLLLLLYLWGLAAHLSGTSEWTVNFTYWHKTKRRRWSKGKKVRKKETNTKKRENFFSRQSGAQRVTQHTSVGSSLSLSLSFSLSLFFTQNTHTTHIKIGNGDWRLASKEDADLASSRLDCLSLPACLPAVETTQTPLSLSLLQFFQLSHSSKSFVVVQTTTTSNAGKREGKRKKERKRAEEYSLTLPRVPSLSLFSLSLSLVLHSAWTYPWCAATLSRRCLLYCFLRFQFFSLSLSSFFLLLLFPPPPVRNS